MIPSTTRDAVAAGLITALAITALSTRTADTEQRDRAPRNIIFILSDDHRYDFMGFHPGAPTWLNTPAMDRMAAGGAHVQNAFVTTSLCSPSRASILTGQYAHRHGVVDNTSPIPKGTVFFPQYLQRAGYKTAFIGKWHMGEDAESDQPRAGFDHWISFRGQGVYTDPVLNINGERRRVQGYTTDILTESALSWLKDQESGRPFFLYLSHKAAHAEFEPAARHRGRHAKDAIPYPDSMANTAANYREKPRWVQEQRNSWHGVDFMYHGQFDFDTFYRRYTETLLALDESIGRILDFLERAGLARNTLVVYMGDNGFMLGEHGLIDKRNAYEESIRVPMLVYAPGLITAGSKVSAVVRNIDVAPTILDLAGTRSDHDVDGRSVLPTLRGEMTTGDGEFLYEYYWEYAFPHTPTTFALRGDRYKFILYHGIWDLNELYDLHVDPHERSNLINVPSHRSQVDQMRTRLFDRLEATGGMQVPVRRGSWQAAERRPSAQDRPFDFAQGRPQAPAGMVYIPGGTTEIGSDDGPPDEQPIFRARVPPFYMDRNLVTVAQFESFVDATGYRTDAERLGEAGVLDRRTGKWGMVAGAWWQRPHGPNEPPAPNDHPVTQVSWNDAAAYAKWAGKRLPTEIEWEHAARGGRNTELGLTEMSGNVWQWTADWYRSYAERDEPFTPARESAKAQRGGSFLCEPDFCHGYRVSARSHSTPDTALFHVGFRLVRDLAR